MVHIYWSGANAKVMASSKTGQLEARSVLTKHLKHLLEYSKKDLPLSYSCLRDLSTIGEIAGRIHKVGGGTATQIKRRELVYCQELLKRVLLTQFELFCVSAELENDVEYAFNECKKICQVADSFSHTQESRGCTCKLEFADFADQIIKSRSRMISQAILESPRKQTFVRLAKFEFTFIRALLGTFATYTDLLHSKHSKQSRMIYVSEEMFSLAQGQGKIIWLDCLIPGAQSKGLRLIAKDLAGRIWGGVAEYVLERLEPITADEWAVTDLLPLLEGLQKVDDLQSHDAVKKCLWYLSSSIRQRACLVQWDSGFQSLLVAMSTDSRKCFKPQINERKTTKSVFLATNSVLAPLTNFLMSSSNPSTITVKPDIISQHLDVLRLSQPVVAALEVSLKQLSMFFSQGVTRCLVNWNLRGLGQSLFVDFPTLREMASKCLTSSTTAAPLFTFPSSSGPYIIENTSRQMYSQLYASYRSLQDTGEELCIAMNTIWSHKCSKTLQAVFPSEKSWKAIGRKSGLQQLKASSYCDIVIEQLLSPILEACLSLPVRAQGMLAIICMSVVFLELRKSIVNNEKVYRPAAGRQLLTDYRHIHQWLSTNFQSISKELSQTVISLPILAEVEYGVLVLCGTAGTGLTHELNKTASSLVLTPHLPLYKEVAWLLESDWTKAIAD